MHGVQQKGRLQSGVGPFQSNNATHRRSAGLEVEACAQLRNARGDTRGGHAPEKRAVHIARRIVELRVVEGVEQIHAKLEFGLLRDVRIFVKGKVAVVDSGAMKEAPSGIACNPDIFRSKRACGEELVAF